MEIHCAYDQLVRVAGLKPHPKNPNTHSTAQVAAIAPVIEGNGWRAPITVSNRSGFITRGHGRLEAALLIGNEQVPVDFQDYASEQAEVADMLADNWLSCDCRSVETLV
jgi:ParB-like chromosome segregation protein Spo0J